MRISFNTWLYAGFPSWLPMRSLDDVIDVVADAGSDGIEIGAAAPHAFPDYVDGARRIAIRERVESRGLEVSAICPAVGGGPGYNPISRDDAERRAAKDYSAKCIRMAADLGCSTVIWLGGIRVLGQPYSEAWSLAVENLQACTGVARDAGVRLAVEPTAADSNLLDHAGDCLRLLDDAGAPPDVAGVMLDTFHIYHRSDDVREAFALAGDRLIYVHVSDLNREAPGTHRDFGEVIGALRDLGYDDWVSAEIGFNRRETHPDTLVRASVSHLRGVLSQ